ncbi:unnamed protein product [Rotaria sp. Silwood1]|nr:unnamed protein product [Rotaria sp. Silwood1]CAF1647363.1 unnamed protein product [Rotaria sp. Silwood1]
MMNNLKDLSDFVNRLPISSKTQNEIYGALVQMVRGSSSINDTIQVLKQVQVVPINEYVCEISYDEVRENIQEKLSHLLDECWLMVPEENAVLFHEACQKLREIFNDICSTLSKQEKEINYLKNQVESMQTPQDELLVGSVATQLIVKMSRFGDTKEHSSIAACRTVSMIMAQAHVEQLKSFLNINGFNFEEICLAIQVLKSNRNSATYPTDPSTSSLDIKNAIDRLFPTISHPKRTIAQKALKVLEILSQELKEPLFLKTD